MTPEPKKAKGARPPKKAKGPTPAPAAENERTPAEIAEDERRLARGAALGIPAVTIVTAVSVAVVMSAGPALLVLAAGILLGTIALFWASLRTLTGDAPLPAELEHATFDASHDALADRKKMLLRALKDLETEKAVAKIDEADYADLAATYRDEIKDIMRAMDTSIAPHVRAAEALLEKHLAKLGLDAPTDEAPENDDDSVEAPEDDDDSVEAPEDDDSVEAPEDDDSVEASVEERAAATASAAATAPSKRPCPACTTANDEDAKFCKSCGKTLSEAPPPSEPKDNPDATSGAEPEGAGTDEPSVDHAK